MRSTLFILACFTLLTAKAQTRILFDATKGETAGNADWIIDADLHNMGYSSNGNIQVGTGNESNPQQIPTPLQQTIGAGTNESTWDGALSFWGIDCVNKGYIVETLPFGGMITYGDTLNSQDLSHYKVLVFCEPNIRFTPAEKVAILDFVNHGGGLFMIADHAISDRNNDGYDSPLIWNDLMQQNASGNTNPFGMIFDQQNFSEQSSNLNPLLTGDSILNGPMGRVTRVQWSNGNSITIDTIANPAARGIIYRANSSGTGTNNIMVASSRYGFGKLVAIADSSPFDDGTGDVNDNLFFGYNGDVSPNHRNLIMNATIWLARQDPQTYIFNGNGNWDTPANWLFKIPPPLMLPAGDTIIINHVSGGNCILNVQEHILPGAALVIAAGKDLMVPGVLQIQ